MTQITNRAERQKITVFRLFNLLIWVPYMITRGIQHSLPFLIVLAVLVTLAEVYIISGNVFDLKKLQMLRLVAFGFVGPVLVYYGLDTDDKILTILGVMLMFTDGSLYLKDTKKTTATAE